MMVLPPAAGYVGVVQGDGVDRVMVDRVAEALTQLRPVTYERLASVLLELCEEWGSSLGWAEATESVAEYLCRYGTQNYL